MRSLINRSSLEALRICRRIVLWIRRWQCLRIWSRIIAFAVLALWFSFILFRLFLEWISWMRLKGLSFLLSKLLFHHLRRFVLWTTRRPSMAIVWDKFVIDAWNLIWIRSKPTCILTCVVFLSSWLTHRIILTTFPIAWLLFQPYLL